MMGRTHREWGAVTGALISAAAGNDPVNVAVCFGMGYALASLPDQVEDKPLSPFRKHRGMSHSWELNALLMLFAWWLPPIVDYPLWGLSLAIFSHLTGDWLFGMAGYGRGAGIPMFLGTKCKGLGRLKVNGWTEPKVRSLLILVKYPALAVACVWSLAHLAV